MDGIDEVLYTALAKGADRAIKLLGDFEDLTNHDLARSISTIIYNINPDLILTGVQANNDLDGSIGPALAANLNLPYIGYISGVVPDNNLFIVHKEYPGSIISEISVDPPAVLGIQASEQPPRYVAVSKVRQTMKTASIEEMQLNDLKISGSPQVIKMYQPEASSHAEMLTGDPDTVAARLLEILKGNGIL